MIMFPFKKYDSDAGRLKIDFHETPRTHRAKPSWTIFILT